MKPKPRLRTSPLSPISRDGSNGLQIDDLNLIGSSPSFLQVLNLIKKIALCDAPVLILGETGTGKEVAARAIHYLGERRDFPFIPINCGAIPDNLVENELFGHAKGAFTDAGNAQTGLIAQAQGGTLFLDEVDTLSPKAQVSLLRFLQDNRYRPLGSQSFLDANVRVIAASNRDLHQMVDQGMFRLDLMFRLNIMDVILPPLRDRIEDIEILGNLFLVRYSAKYNQPMRNIDPETLKRMRAYHWPGNVRELENILHKAFLLSDDRLIRLPDFEAKHADRNVGFNDHHHPPAQWNFKEAKTQVLGSFEKQFLKKLMVETHGNISEASIICGKERSALGKLLKKYAIDKNLYDASG